MRNKINAGYYYSVAPGWVLSVTGEAGYIFGWGGQHVLIQDRFFVGGDNLRGFASPPVSGRATSSRSDALGRQQVLSSARSRSACRLACRRNWASPDGSSPTSGRLYGNDQKNLVLTPAQLASQPGGLQPQIIDSAGICA